MTPEQDEKLAALKGAYLANLAKVHQAGSKEERDRAIAEHVNSYIAEIGNDRELAEAFLTWLKDHVGWMMVNEGIGRHTVLSQQYISDATPTGAALVPGGATFRVWAPRAVGLYLNGVFGGRAYDQQTEDRLLSKNPRGYWTGFQERCGDCPSDQPPFRKRKRRSRHPMRPNAKKKRNKTRSMEASKFCDN